MLSSSRSSLLAVVLTLLMVGSVAFVALGPTALAQSQDSLTPIDKCQEIDESGEYVLTQDLSGDGDGCIYITGEDVTIDGQGYTVENGDIVGGDETGSGIYISQLTIKNVHVPDGEIVHTSSDGAVESVTAQHITVYDGITGTIKDSVITGAGGDSLRQRAGIYVTDGAVIVENTTIRGNDVGIGAGEATFDIDVRNSEIRNNEIGFDFGGDPIEYTVQNSVIAGNDVSAVGGVRDVDMTNNYWGAADGPSSIYSNGTAPADPWVDPETGALANGSGDGVLGYDRSQEADVLFDPWLTEPPNAGGDGAPAPPENPTTVPTTTADSYDGLSVDIASGTDADNDGYQESIILDVRADTRLPDSDTSDVGEPYFIIELNGDVVKTTGQVERTPQGQFQFLLSESDIGDIERGTHEITVRLMDEDIANDDEIVASTISADLESAQAVRTTTATQTTTEPTPTPTETTIETTTMPTPTPTPEPTTTTLTTTTTTTGETTTATTTETTMETTTTAIETETTVASPTPTTETTVETTAEETTTTEETAVGTPQTDTATETVGAQPTTATETVTDTTGATETSEETTTMFEEGTAPIGGTTTTTETGVPGIPGFGVGGALVAILAAVLLALRSWE